MANIMALAVLLFRNAGRRSAIEFRPYRQHFGGSDGGGGGGGDCWAAVFELLVWLACDVVVTAGGSPLANEPDVEFELAEVDPAPEALDGPAAVEPDAGGEAGVIVAVVLGAVVLTTAAWDDVPELTPPVWVPLLCSC
jgi:hypothetical protein